VLVARVGARRDRHSLVLLGTFAAGLAAQFAGQVVNANPRNLEPPRSTRVWALTWFLLRPVPQVLPPVAVVCAVNAGVGTPAQFAEGRSFG
jgi:hypothetical protein